MGVEGRKVCWNYKNLAASPDYMNVNPETGVLEPFTLLSKLPDLNGPRMQPPQEHQIAKLLAIKDKFMDNFKVNNTFEGFFTPEDIQYWSDQYALLVSITSWPSVEHNHVAGGCHRPRTAYADSVLVCSATGTCFRPPPSGARLHPPIGE
jgi:hypothetical protein